MVNLSVVIHFNFQLDFEATHNATDFCMKYLLPQINEWDVTE